MPVRKRIACCGPRRSFLTVMEALKVRRSERPTTQVLSVDEKVEVSISEVKYDGP